MKIFTKEHRDNLSKSLTELKRTKEEVESNRKRSIEWHKLNTNPKSKKVTCSKTGNILNSITECAKENKLVYDTLKSKLNGSNKNNTTYKYL